MKLLFMPMSVIGGLIAGFLGKKLFDELWGLFDDQAPPDAKHLEISRPKLVAAAAMQGAIFGAVREVTDHSTRRAFMNLTGKWPGEERPEPE